MGHSVSRYRNYDQGRSLLHNTVRTPMTSVAAISFPSSTDKSDIRDTGIQPHVRSTTQNTRLRRSGNLVDWKSRHADIQLLPTSCTDIYHDMVVHGNSVPLLDSESAPHPVSVNHTVLTTRHTKAILQQRCRQLEAETAQDKQAASNLYVAAGFVLYTSNGEKKRAPLLLLPVTLQRIRGRASNYAITYSAGQWLRVNPHVADMCSSHVDQLVKPFDSTTDLREYLRSFNSNVHKDFNCKITANTGIVCLPTEALGELSRAQYTDLELDRTQPGTEFTPLPAIPAGFDAQLAIRAMRFIEPEVLHEALYNFAGQTNTSTSPVLNSDPDLDSDTLEKFHNCAGWLIDVGLGHWQLKNIAKLPRRIEAMESSINQLLANSSFTKYFRDEYQTVEILYRLNKAKDKILNAPPEMQYHSISMHADTTTRLLLQQAKIQASSVEHEMKHIDKAFDLNAVPDHKTLSRLIEVIARRDDKSQLANPEYFSARQKLNDILTYHNAILTDNDLDRLDKLAKTLQFSETFNNDPYYKRHFGSLFKGTDTNWQRLDSVVNFNHWLSQALGSSLLVAQFADQWVSFERDFNSIAANIETAASSAHKLCSLIPMFIKPDTKLEHASRTAEKFRCRVDQWQRYLHRHYADSELTPLQLLSHLDLGDHSYPSVTLSQHELNEKIYRHIAAQGLSTESVSVTAKWLLNVLVKHETDTATVRMFLDREASLHSSLQ